MRHSGRSAHILAAAVLALAGTLAPASPAGARSDPCISGGICVQSVLGTVLRRVWVLGPGIVAGQGLGPLASAGGPIQKNPKVYVVYWGWTGDPSGEAPYLEAFLNGVGGSSWANIDTQYGEPSRGNVTNPAGQLAGTWSDPAPIPAAPTDADLAAEAVAAVNHFGYDQDADYFVATPQGHSTPGFKTSFCAWHGSVANPGNPSQQIAFTNLPYMTDAGGTCGQSFVNSGAAGLLDGVSIVAGHEYAETVTDPVVGSGWTDQYGYEIGDKCAWVSVGPGHAQDITLSTGTFAVQGLYSNAAVPALGGCAISYP